MATAVDVIIFFVGLTLWSEQLPNDCGVKAILPRVVQTISTGTMPSESHLEDHKAALIFRRESLVSQTGWEEVKTLPKRNPDSTTEPVYQYVSLDGDSVRFLTNGAANDPPSMTGMRLPKLRQFCPAMLNLGANFRGPSYPGAAAVVSLPAGAIRACLSVPGESQGRLDTRLDLKTNGNLVVASIMAGKVRELRLKPREDGRPIELIVANVPESYYERLTTDGERAEHHRLSHLHGYYNMGEPRGGDLCTAELQTWWEHLDPEGIPLCTDTFPETGRNASMPPDVTLSLAQSNADSIVTSGANYECSNTQWP